MKGVSIYNKLWKVVSTKEFDAKIFSAENINESLIHEYYVMYLANKRAAIAHVKTRGDVSYSGRKLFRQKWTGNARSWDAGSPIKRHGWVTFWPSNARNFKKAMPTKMRKEALRSSFIKKLSESNVFWMEANLLDSIKTKDAANFLKSTKLDWKKTLVVIDSKNDIIVKSFSNLKNISLCYVDYINPYLLLVNQNIVFDQNALDKMEKILQVSDSK